MKLQAFTIIESITAMIVIMISFSAGMLLYFTMLKGDAFPVKTKAQNVLDVVWEESKEQERFLDESFLKEGFLIEKKIFFYKRKQSSLLLKDIYQLSLKAFTKEEKLMAQQQHLIRVDYEN